MQYDQLVRSSVGLEIFSLATLFIPIPYIQKAPVALLLHLIAVSSVYAWLRTNIDVKTNALRKIRTIFFTLLAYLLPPIGPVILLIYADRLKKIEVPEDLSHIKAIEMPYFESETKFRPNQFGEGGAYAQVTHHKVSPERRIKALLALDTGTPQQKNSLLHSVLVDEEDEVRLVAFGLLKRQEQTLLSELHLAQEEVAKPQEDPILHAQANKRLARVYWEMVYQDLAMDDLFKYSLDHAAEYAKKALQVLDDDVGLWVLLGKIHLRQKDYAGAEAALTKAQQLGGAASQMIPYLAELCFYKKNYQELHELLAHHPHLKTIPHFGPVYEFWQHG